MKKENNNKTWLTLTERMLTLIIFLLLGIWYHFDIFGFGDKFTLILMALLAGIYIITFIQSLVVSNQKDKKEHGKRRRKRI